MGTGEKLTKLIYPLNQKLLGDRGAEKEMRISTPKKRGENL